MAQLGVKTIYELTNSSSIVKELFLVELSRLDDYLLKIIKQNEECSGWYNTAGFMYLGEFYQGKNATRAPTHGERVVLHESLYDMMTNYLNQSARLLRECHMVNQMVFRLVQGCSTKQDIRDVLPECLVAQDKDSDFMSLERTRPAAFTIQNDDRALRQYKMVLPLMEYYAGSKLLF